MGSILFESKAECNKQASRHKAGTEKIHGLGHHLSVASRHAVLGNKAAPALLARHLTCWGGKLSGCACGQQGDDRRILGLQVRG